MDKLLRPNTLSVISTVRIQPPLLRVTPVKAKVKTLLKRLMVSPLQPITSVTQMRRKRKEEVTEDTRMNPIQQVPNRPIFVNSASVNLNTTLLSSMTCEVLLITPRVYTSGVFV